MKEKSQKNFLQPGQEEREESGRPRDEEMEAINRYTRREFAPQEIYAFTVVLCDNEVDRDLERFTTQTLEQLSHLFEGKTGIFDHHPGARQQTARIFRCWTEKVPGRITSAGEEYCRLMARAYLPRSQENQSMILALESGIHKEVSVGCAVAKNVCSICGADWRQEHCGHRKGEMYGDRLCVGILEEATDAYEWSFVAVPAQKSAGVVKQFVYTGVWENREQENGDKANQKRHTPGETEEDLHLSGEECLRLEKRISRLEEEAELGRQYRRDLQKSIRRLGGLVLPKLPGEQLEKLMEHLSLSELKSFEKAFLHSAGEKLPLQVQLAPQNREKDCGPTPYTI